MGITGLARWSNSTPEDFLMMQERLVKKGGLVIRSGPRWRMTMRSYRYVPPTITAATLHTRSERVMQTVTTVGSDPCTYVWLEDGSVPTRGEFKSTLEQGGPETAEKTKLAMRNDEESSHFRTTFITLKPPESLDLLLLKGLGAPWLPGRHGAAAQDSHRPHLFMDGPIFHFGTDWIVRLGQLTSPAGGPKGIVLEAEYLPLINMPPRDDGALAQNTFLSSFLASLFPNSPNARRSLVSMEEELWTEASAEDIFEGVFTVVEKRQTDSEAKKDAVDPSMEKPQSDERRSPADQPGMEARSSVGAVPHLPAHDDMGFEEEKLGFGLSEGIAPDDAQEEVALSEDDWVYGAETAPKPNRLDWFGPERERRSAFSIIAILRRENLI